MGKIRVLFLAAELNPLAKVGGLADVIGALPKSLIKQSVDVRIMIPRYGIVDKDKYGLRTLGKSVKVSFNNVDEEVQIYQTYLPDSRVIIYLIENYKYLSEGGVYFEKDASSGGTPKECQRFSFFTKSCVEIIPHLNWWPEIIHHHDWHVGMLPVFLKIKALSDDRYKKIKSILNIHNLAYQGKYNHAETLKLLDLNEEDFPTLGIKFGENQDINFLQQSIINTDLIIAVSPNYAREILTKEYGEGLERDLETRKKDIYGILNGIDIEKFNPENDPNIIKNYSAKNIENKKADKLYLQKAVGLEENPEIPLFGFVGRLSEQKGIDLVGQIIDDLAKKNIQLVVLGAGLDPFEKIALTMAQKYPRNVIVKIAFDAKLAQQIYAGADFFLMPSRFEPCGLGQMISMRYGTIPIARATGGLKDSVTEFNIKTREGTGFLFNNYEPSELFKTINRGLEIFKNKELWSKIINNAIQQDFSWEKSSKKYIELYKKILKR